MSKKELLLRAVNALYLEAPAMVMDDVKKIVFDYIDSVEKPVSDWYENIYEPELSEKPQAVHWATKKLADLAREIKK